MPDESFRLYAIVNPENVVDVTITWKSSDESVATVDAEGKVTAVSVGEAVITATSASYSDISASCTVTVTNVFTVDGIIYRIMDNDLKTCRVANNSENENLPAEIVIPATVSPFDGVEYTVTGIEADAFENCSGITSVVISEGVTFVDQLAFWGCSSLASIEIPQSVKSIGEGAFGWCSSLTSAVIPEGVTSIGNQFLLGCSSLTTVVIPNSVTSIGDNAFYGCEKLTSIIIPDEVASIGENAFGMCPNLETITYNGSNSVRFPDNCFDQDVYESAKFTAPNLTSEKFEASSWKNFSNTAIKLSSIALNEESWSGYVGASVELSASLVPDNAIPTDIVWSTSDEKIATVDAEGKVTAVALGEAVITATASDNTEIKATCAVTVVPTPVESISLDKGSLELIVKQSATLSATILPEDATDKTVTWSTSDEKIATVDAEGKVTAVSVGEVTITAVANGDTDISASCAVKVLPILVSAITLNETEVSLRVNGSVTLTAEVAPNDATNGSIVWSTSDEKIATVDTEGKVTAVALGEAVITATAADGSGVKAECAIKVV
ncbi:MAG: Ig-like domain-containing protein, partial [Muribaculaceae bacterium]|nr:Ig-like domain-containing protein [Muribaculaceae bacterium]